MPLTENVTIAVDAMGGDNAPGDTGAKAPAPVRVTKIGRNDPCPCGSGLKWKKCTCKEYHPDLR